VRAELTRFRGRELDTAGDGFFASFDGPARAIRCACAITNAVRDLGLEIRAGLHTGECEQVDGKVGGIAVHIGARVASLAGPGEVLVSQTVHDLVVGSQIAFEDRGERELKASRASGGSTPSAVADEREAAVRTQGRADPLGDCGSRRRAQPGERGQVDVFNRSCGRSRAT
jgi:Adenylate and Guanylate cyclase catalytic domain